MSQAQHDKFVPRTLADFGRFKSLRRLQVGLLVVCYGAIASAIAVKLLANTPSAVIALGLLGAASALASFVPGRRADRILATAQEVLRIMEEADLRKARQGAQRPVPLTIGFANFSGPEMEAWVAEDAAALAGLFVSSTTSHGSQPAKAQVLFVYAQLAEDGTVKGPVETDIRTLAQLSGAQIVVLASPNVPARVQSAALLAGPKVANIVITIDRNGSSFGRFFAELFGRMRAGSEMLDAWVALAPQGPDQQQATAPVTILLAEAGKLGFPG